MILNYTCLKLISKLLPQDLPKFTGLSETLGGSYLGFPTACLG